MDRADRVTWAHLVAATLMDCGWTLPEILAMTWGEALDAMHAATELADVLPDQIHD